jgi:hypothetical protein
MLPPEESGSANKKYGRGAWTFENTIPMALVHTENVYDTNVPHFCLQKRLTTASTQLRTTGVNGSRHWLYWACASLRTCVRFVAPVSWRYNRVNGYNFVSQSSPAPISITSLG